MDIIDIGTVRDWAELHDLQYDRALTWARAGILDVQRIGGHFVIALDHPVPDLEHAKRRT